MLNMCIVIYISADLTISSRHGNITIQTLTFYYFQIQDKVIVNFVPLVL